MKVHKGMLSPWNSMKEEKTNELELVQKDNRNPKLTLHKYVKKYVFNEFHEVFFYDLPHLLREWVLILNEKDPKN
jgi:hypothetical protein